jgi:hypothetical protein
MADLFDEPTEARGRDAERPVDDDAEVPADELERHRERDPDETDADVDAERSAVEHDTDDDTYPDPAEPDELDRDLDGA